ncbi:MAG: hypothetical protein WDA68_03460 [Phycisphaerae bacterium]
MRLLFVFTGIFCVLSSMAFAGKGDGTTKPDGLYVIHTPNDSDIVGKSDITIEQLAEIIEQMEDSIRDVSIEYEWRVEPPYTFEESEKVFSVVRKHYSSNAKKKRSGRGPKTRDLPMSKDGVIRHRLIASDFSKIEDVDGIRFNWPKMSRLEDYATFVAREGNSWDCNIVHVMNGEVYKFLTVQDQPQEIRSGYISDSDGGRSLVITPLGFSVFRSGMTELTAKKPLSEVLRMPNIARLDDNIRKVNGFNAVRVDLMIQSSIYIIGRIYFSIDHNYTPIRHAFTDPAMGNETLVFDVESFQQVSEGIWLPSAGVMKVSNTKHINRFIATGPIQINQGFETKDFALDFPPGTEVLDRITGKSYTVSILE